MATVIGQLVALIGTDNTGLKRGTKDAEATLDKSTKKMGSILERFKGAVLGAFSVVAVQRFSKSVIMAGVQMDKMVRSMEAATGSAAAQQSAMALLRKESERLGTYLPTQIKGFQQLAAATQGTVLQGQHAVDIFTSLSEASTALQLSSDETSGAIRAITQIISKGKVQAEELRGQLGERLPGAFQLAASAMKMTTEELSKALELGEVYANDFIPKFAKALKERYANAWENSSKSSQAAINRMNTAWFEFRASLFESGLDDFFAGIVEGLTVTLKFWRENLGHMKNFFVVDFIDTIGRGWIHVRDHFVLIMTFIGGAFQAGLKYMLETYASFMTDLASMTEGIPFLETLTTNLRASGLEALKSAQGMKHFGDILAEQTAQYQSNLTAHNDKINAMLVENTALGELVTNTQTYAEAVGQVSEKLNEQALIQAEMRETALQLREHFANSAAQKMEEDDALLAKIEELRAANVRAAEDRAAAEISADLAVMEAKFRRKKEEEQLEKAKQKIQMQTVNQAIQNSKFALKEFGKDNATAFAAFKAVSIAETVVNTAKAAMGAYSAMSSIPYVGPVLGAVAAVAAIAAGAAQIATISSMSAGGGGSATTAGLSSGGGAGAASAIGTYAASPTTGLPDLQTGAGGGQGNNVVINMEGVLVDSDERKAELMDDFRRFFEEKDIISTTSVR